MQDARLKIASVMALSVSAFISMPGALLVLLWWLVFTKRLKSIKNKRVFGMLVIFLVVTGFFITLSGGPGPDYIMKMIIIFIIAAWVYSTYIPGDFMSFSVWLLGEGMGFEIGMIAEMAINAIDDIIRDYYRIRTAMEIKGERFSAFSLIQTGMTLVINQLERADGQAKILKVRGYTRGGRYATEFPFDVAGILGAITAFLILLVSVFSFSDVFIVIQ